MKFMRVVGAVVASLLAVIGLASILKPTQAADSSGAAPLDVVINEVAWGGTAANSGHEWIELKNNTSLTLDLSGWRLFSNDGTPNLILSNTLPISGYFLLERATDSTISDIPADFIYPGALNNTGEVLTLTDSLGNVIDTANHDGGGWPGGSGSPGYYSMERIDPFWPDIDSNWHSNDGFTRNGLDANGNPITGTPKAQNSVYSTYAPPQAMPGSVLISAVHWDAYANGDEGFRLTNVSTQSIALTNWIVTDGEGAIDLTGTLEPDRSIWLAKNAITFTQQFGFQPDYEYADNSDPAVPNLVAPTVPLLAPGDELAVREGLSNWIDAVVWGATGQITGIDPISPANLWIGSNVYPYTGTASTSHQILYRKLAEVTGTNVV